MDLNYDSAFSVVLSLTMFCQKSPGHLDLAALVDTSGIQHVSVHATCSLVPSISSIDRRMHILWSRVGLEEVVDGRGCLYLCLSFDQCANYQSNLDGRPLDVVCCGEESRGSLNFIQVYGDSPHTHMSHHYRHSVSGVITVCGLMHRNVNTAMNNCAQKYMAHMVDMENKMSKPLTCRLEQVRVFKGGDCPSLIRPEALFSEQSLLDMLAEKPMLVLCFASEDGLGVMAVVQETMQYLKNAIKSGYGGKRGGYDSSCTTYQAELALEELLYGHILSPEDHQLTVSLGTSASHRDSVTWMRGFLGLAPHTSYRHPTPQHTKKVNQSSS